MVATPLARATATVTTSAPLEQPTTPELPALKAEACEDTARKVAAAKDDKPARSWAKRMQRRTHTSYRLTLKLSRLVWRSKQHGKLYLPCCLWSDTSSA
jgi:hypothetical protein